MAVFTKYSKYRFKGNHLSLFSLVFIVCFQSVLCQWHPSYTRKQVRIFEGTAPESLHNIMPYEPFDYTEPNISRAFASSTRFYSKGMGHLYYFTNLFINTILKDQAYPEGFLQVVDGNTIQLADVRTEWAVYYRHYGPTLAVLLTVALLGLLLPLAGLLFCCCRCTGRCSARTQPFDKRYDFCRRHIYGSLLCALTVLVSFGVVCAFVTNENLEEGAHNLGRELRTSLSDVDLYVNNTKVEVNHLLINNFNEFDRSITKILKASGEIVKNKLGSVSKAAVLTNLTNIVHGLATIRNDLKEIDSLTRSLQDTAEQLDIALREFRLGLLQKLNQCKNDKPCKDLLRKYNIKDLTLEANFTEVLQKYIPKLPNVTASLQNISELISSDIEQEVLKGKRAFENIKEEIQRSVDEHIPEIKEYIGKTGERLQSGARDINRVLDRFHQMVEVEGTRSIDHGEVLLKQYGHYRYYVGLGVSFILLTVLLCLSLGLLCGFCGSRPDSGYSDDCCNKGSGASFLMLGVWVMFISAGALAFVSLLYFISGVTASRVLCEPLQTPGSSRIFSLLDELVDLSAMYGGGDSPPAAAGGGGKIRYEVAAGQRGGGGGGEEMQLKLSDVVRSCHKNSSLFTVLQLRHYPPLADLLAFPSESNPLRSYIRQLSSSMQLHHTIQILTPEAQNQLVRLSSSPLSDMDFPAYSHILGERITSIDLLALGAALNETVEKLPPSQNDLKLALKNNVMYLALHQQNHVVGMLDYSKRLEAAAALLHTHLKFNHSSLRAAVDHLLLEVEDAQLMLDRDGAALVTKLGAEFGSEVEKHIDHYVARVMNHLEGDVGKCWPLSLVYNATVVSGCGRLLAPYNGFWFSVGGVFLLFIPAIVLAVKLAALYQKSDPYPGPLVEEEYLYDAYASNIRDQIPLSSNVGKKKKRKAQSHPPGGPSAGDYGGPDAMNPDYSAHLGRHERNRVGGPSSGASPAGVASGSNNLDPRFSDMAPKNWDFPNGGPPRYQQQTPLSTEYERPPPYYYPGPPGSRNSIAPSVPMLSDASLENLNLH